MKTLTYLNLGIVFVLLTCSSTVAQLSTGSLSGTVTDPTGSTVPGATVKVTHTQTGRIYDTITSDAGLYAFPSLEVGPYTLMVEQSGFKKLERSGIIISISTRSVVDVVLEIGQVSEVVQVSAEAPVLSKATAELGTSFQPKFMKDAPLFLGGGLRNPEAFIAFTPGVNNGSGDSSINGGNRRRKEVLVDGAGMTIPESGGVVFNFPAVEQFGEFKILTNNFNANMAGLAVGSRSSPRRREPTSTMGRFLTFTGTTCSMPTRGPTMPPEDHALSIVRMSLVWL